MSETTAVSAKRVDTGLFVKLSLLFALEIIVAFTPLGSLPLFGTSIVATTAHLPVIVAAVLLGRKAGLFMGTVFGVLSFIVWSFYTPSPAIAFAFTPVYPIPGTDSGSFLSLIVVIVPRVLLGLITAELYSLFKKLNLGNIACPLACILATVLHTVMVLGSIYIFFGEPYAEANNIAYSALLGAMALVIATNGVFEAVLAAVFGTALSKIVPALEKK